MEGDDKPPASSIELSLKPSSRGSFSRPERDQLLGQALGQPLLDHSAVRATYKTSIAADPSKSPPPAQPPCCLLRVRAQVMRRDDSSGGWLPMEGGGLSQIALHESCGLGSGRKTYLITGRRIADNMPILECGVEGGGMQYIRANPTFHHWRTFDNRRFGLTFQSPHQANAFDTGLHTAIRSLAEGNLGPTGVHPPALRLMTCVTTSSSLTSTIRSTFSPSDIGVSPIPPIQVPLGVGGESLQYPLPACSTEQATMGEILMAGGPIPYYVSPRHHRRYVGSLRHSPHTFKPSPHTSQGVITTSHNSPLTTIIIDEPKQPKPLPTTPPTTNGALIGGPPLGPISNAPDQDPVNGDSYMRHPSLPKYYDTGGGGADCENTKTTDYTPTTRTSPWWPQPHTTPAGVHCKYWKPGDPFPSSSIKAKGRSNNNNNGTKIKRSGRRLNIVPTKASKSQNSTAHSYHSARGSNPPRCSAMYGGNDFETAATSTPFTRLARTLTCLRCASCFIFTATGEEWEDPCYCPPLFMMDSRPTKVPARPRPASFSSPNNSDDTSSLGSVTVDGPDRDPSPFSPQTKSTFVRWSLLGLLSLLLPCLCLYPLFKCCYRFGIWSGLCARPTGFATTPIPSRRHKLGQSSNRPSSVSTSTTITIQP